MVNVGELGKDERLVITREKRAKEHMPPYTMVGNGFSTRHGTSVDIIEVCSQLNLSENRLLQFMRDCYTYNCIRGEKNPNIVEPSKWDEWNEYLRIALKKNYPHLEHLRVLVRLKRGAYMVNPYMLISSTGRAEIVAIWEEAVSKIELKESPDDVLCV